MININLILKKKTTKFIIAIIVIILAFLNYYKRNKKKVDEAIFLYSKLQQQEAKAIKEQQRKNDTIEQQGKEKQPIVKKNEELPHNPLIKKEKPTPWVDKNIEEFRNKKREIIEIEKRKEKLRLRNELIAKISEDKLNGKDIARIINEKNRFGLLLKEEYTKKKKNGRINYARKIKDNDYIYVSLKPIVDNVDIQKKIDKIGDLYFVLKVDSTKPKSFNKKIIGKKINDVVRLKVEDFLSNEKIKELNKLREETREATKIYAEKYPYLKEVEYDKFVDKHMYYSYELKIYDVLDAKFIKDNDIDSKIFDYNAQN